MFFIETWLNDNIPDWVIELHGHCVHRADRSAVDTGKNRGGAPCIYTNKSWCTDSAIIRSHSSVDLEFLMIKCRPYLPREFTVVVLTAVYVPTDPNAKLAMKELYAAISTQLKHTQIEPLLLWGTLTEQI